MKTNIDWVALEQIEGGTRILEALRLALDALDRGKTSIAKISDQSGVPASSLSSIKCHGPYAHRLKLKTHLVVCLALEVDTLEVDRLTGHIAHITVLFFVRLASKDSKCIPAQLQSPVGIF